MAKYKRGLIAGAIAGLFSSLLSLVLTAGLYLLAYIITALGEMLNCALVGAIIGIIYAHIYDRLPGRTSIKKALVLSICTLLVEVFCFIIIWMVALNSANSLLLKYIPSSSGILSIFGTLLANQIIFGFLLGWLWDKFGSKN
jgi:hypothetical protein